MNYEELVNQCRELRTAFERDEARFLIGLVRVEREHMDLLRENGCSTFVQFLRSHHLCDGLRYERFRKGLEAVGSEATAEQIGAEAVCKAAQATTPEKAQAFTEAALAFRAQEGVAPRGQTVTRLLASVDPQAKTPRVIKALDETTRLRAQLEELKAELRAVKAERDKAIKRAEKAERALLNLRTKAA